jgi:tyrosine-protein phosphatase YwqE
MRQTRVNSVFPVLNHAKKNEMLSKNKSLFRFLIHRCALADVEPVSLDGGGCDGVVRCLSITRCAVPF